jgi:two-component system sensor histidine kinase AtoS
MKKQVAISMSIVIFLFLAGGVYIIASIETASSKLDRLIKLHQVEILREHLLIQIHKVQTDFLLMDGAFASTHEAVAANVSNLQTVSTTCTDCHHRPGVQERLDRLLNEIDIVRANLQQFLTSQAMGQRSLVREMAYQLLEHLEIQVNGMIHMASAKLSAETNNSIDSIARSKMILYALVVLTPLVAGVLVFFFMRGMAKPLELLLEATRKLKNGEFDYHIEGLNREFAEVATSFNQMSDSLRQKIYLLGESEKRYRMLFESAGDAIFILDTEGDQRGKIVAANRAAAEMHGYTREEMQQLGIGELDTPQEGKLIPDRMRRILAGEWIKEEITHRRKDGSEWKSAPD